MAGDERVVHAPRCTGCCDQGEQSHWEVIHCECCRAVRGEDPEGCPR